MSGAVLRRRWGGIRPAGGTGARSWQQLRKVPAPRPRPRPRLRAAEFRLRPRNVRGAGRAELRSRPGPEWWPAGAGAAGGARACETASQIAVDLVLRAEPTWRLPLRRERRAARHGRAG